MCSSDLPGGAALTNYLNGSQKPASSPAAPTHSYFDKYSGAFDNPFGSEQGGPVTDQGTFTPEGQPQKPGPTDSVPTMLAPGEYVIPAEVVRFLGTQFFDKLLDKTQQQIESKQQSATEGTGALRGMNMGGQVYPNQQAAPAVQPYTFSLSDIHPVFA